jgi:MoxR-like ATPase
MDQGHIARADLDSPSAMREARPVALPVRFRNPAELAGALDEAGYLADAGLAAAGFLALQLRRPLFLEGEPGVGKTSFAQAMAAVTMAELVRLQCYGGIDASQAVYDWNFPRQILQLRAAQELNLAPNGVGSVYTRDFLVERPILRAILHSPSVLLIDEIDRADDEFEALLLEVLESDTVTIPELGPIRADIPPLVVLTSNRTREVHDALKRRCLYHWITHPDPDREVRILRRTLPQLPDQLARDVAMAMQRLRSADLVKPPGVGEAIDLARAAQVLGQDSLTEIVAVAATGTVAKHNDDYDRVRHEIRGEHR